jgi:hypothetical protein
MRGALRHRQRAQSIAFAAVGMVAIVGGLAIVVDAGIFLVVQRQLQTAADAGALAGAWHDPICPGTSPGCLGPPNSASTFAVNVAQANGDTVKQLCGGVVTVDPPATGTTLIRPANVNTIVVTVKCQAGYSFGRILGLDRKLVTASAAAAIGNRISPSNGDMTDFADPPANPAPYDRIARLID